MKKIGLIALVSALCCTFSTLGFAADSMQASRVAEYITLGNIENPVLIQLLKESQDRFCTLSKSRPCKGILIDGQQSDVKMIEKSVEIKAAISKSVPIVISKPSFAKMEAITGAGVSHCEAAVIVARNKGQEFEIYTLRPKSKICGLGKTNRVESYSSTIQRIVGTNQKPARHAAPSKEDEKLLNLQQAGQGRVALAGQHHKNVNERESHTIYEDTMEDNNQEISKHRRWYILDADSYIWGEQGAYIRNGFQYDLVYVKPERKYLIMRTIGSGVSPGHLRHNHRLHRGYFQNRVDVSFSGYGHDGWTGEKLFLESYAPQSLNRLNQDQSTVGVNIGFNAIAGVGFMSNTGVDNAGAQVGFTVYDQHSVASTYDDYSVTFESTASIEKWSFWLSGAEGVPLRKRHQKRDLLCRRFFLFDTIRELPQLATGPVLQPDVQAVYYTTGDQQGKWTMTGTTEQHLLDVRSWILFGTSRKKSEKVVGKVTIDFSKVGDTPDENCK